MRKTTITTTCLALAILLGAATTLQRPLREAWLISRLGSDDLVARFDAASALEEMRSLRALPRILEESRIGIMLPFM